MLDLRGVAVGFLRRADSDLARRMWRRSYNLSLSAGVKIVIGTLILILNWPAIHDYYVVGHFVSNEKYIRAAELGTGTQLGISCSTLNRLSGIIWDKLSCSDPPLRSPAAWRHAVSADQEILALP